MLPAVTYGVAIINPHAPRTPHSFMPEFEASLGAERVTALQFATQLGNFFHSQWTMANMPANIDDMVFLVGGMTKGSLMVMFMR
jgi:hypothetical protein